MNTKREKYKKVTYGDIFYFELPNKKYVVGRVLFDMEKQCAEKGLAFEDESYLSAFRDYECQLIEMYKGIYDNPNDIQIFEPLIPRVIVYGVDTDLNNLPYGVLTNEKVDYTKVEFPEKVGNTCGFVRLLRGELPLAIEDTYSFDEEFLEGFRVCFGAEYPAVIPNICLYMQGREDLIVGKFYARNGLNDWDLLYHPELRRKLYQRIGEDPDKSYYELALSHGYDLGRFY